MFVKVYRNGVHILHNKGLANPNSSINSANSMINVSPLVHNATQLPGQSFPLCISLLSGTFFNSDAARCNTPHLTLTKSCLTHLKYLAVIVYSTHLQKLYLAMRDVHVIRQNELFSRKFLGLSF